MIGTTKLSGPCPGLQSGLTVSQTHAGQRALADSPSKVSCECIDFFKRSTWFKVKSCYLLYLLSFHTLGVGLGFVAGARKFCEMIVPISLLLAAQASDERLSPQTRASSMEGLRALGTEFVVCLGLYTDLATETALFLRQFDDAWHDPALTQIEVGKFSTRTG